MSQEISARKIEWAASHAMNQLDMIGYTQEGSFLLDGNIFSDTLDALVFMALVYHFLEMEDAYLDMGIEAIALNAAPHKKVSGYVFGEGLPSFASNIVEDFEAFRGQMMALKDRILARSITQIEFQTWAKGFREEMKVQLSKRVTDTGESKDERILSLPKTAQNWTASLAGAYDWEGEKKEFMVGYSILQVFNLGLMSMNLLACLRNVIDMSTTPKDWVKQYSFPEVLAQSVDTEDFVAHLYNPMDVLVFMDCLILPSDPDPQVLSDNLSVYSERNIPLMEAVWKVRSTERETAS